MIDLISTTASVLADFGFSTRKLQVSGRDALAFEDDTVLGFVFGYADARELVDSWSSYADQAIANHQFGLRHAGLKAWNAYVVLLAEQDADYAHDVVLGAIEEDLVGTRKIARAGVSTIADVRAALLPLLPIQAAPQLEAVDIVAEIRLRTTELQPRAVEAFLSGVDESQVIQVLEEAP